jgi:hypothetical protein
MRKLFPFLSILIITACEEVKTLKMEGAYSMKAQTMNDGSKDTSIRRRQMKIYTDGYVITQQCGFPTRWLPMELVHIALRMAM